MSKVVKVERMKRLTELGNDKMEIYVNPDKLPGSCVPQEGLMNAQFTELSGIGQ